MKRSMWLLVCFLLVALLLAGCKKESVLEPVYHTVTFDSNGGTPVSPMTVQAGKMISAPEDPTRENYIFDGWKNGGEKWDFSYHVVESDITLKASWVSAADVFDYRTVEGTDDAILTRLKKEYPTLNVPSTINGFSVVGIGEGVFAELSSENVYKIVVPDTVTEMGARAFADSPGIEIEVRGELLSVGEEAFSGCTGLRAVRLGEGVRRIPVNAFAGSGLRSLFAPSTLEVIEENAFMDCASLQTIVLYGTMAQTDAAFAVQDSAFADCDALKTVFLYGTEADRESLIAKTDHANESFKGAVFCYYSESAPTDQGHYWYLHDGEPRVW